MLTKLVVENDPPCCVYCGRPEDKILWTDRRSMEEFGILICQGICVIALEVDDTLTDY